ncbi:hypothetical protein JVU11DRAFT_2457 [Chiua virens]|nr:hypothetical protein JVU11DRAFT_2457 [Chiua virens]
MNRDLHAQPTSMATLNVLFLGETHIGESSILDLAAGAAEQNRTLRHTSHHALGDDVRSVTLNDKMFILYATPTSESSSPVALREGIQNTLMALRKNGGVHLLVYCLDASHPTRWIHEMHHTITSYPALSSSRIPAVAVITGLSVVAQQEAWWTNNEDALTEQGLRFDDHAFIPMMTHNCADSPKAETDSDFQRTALYKLRSAGNSFQSLLVLLGGKPSSHTSASCKVINVVLLGEIGVGKSSLINVVAGKNVAGVSPDTIGCTKTATKYTFEEKGVTFHIYDTPGLVDPQMGVQAFVSPIDSIQHVIHGLDNGHDPALLLFCIDKSKPTTALRRNYRLFSKIICGGQIPSALTITKLEQGQNVDQWWSKNGPTIRKYGIDYSGYIGLGCEKRDFNSDAEGELRESLLSFFITCTNRRKNRMSSLRSSMGRVVGSVTFRLRSRAPSPASTLMAQCGLEEQIARELLNRIGSLKQLNGGGHI